MKVTFRRRWRRFREGETVDGYPAGAGRLLIRRGIAEEVSPDKDTPAPKPSRRRGRPPGSKNKPKV